MAKALVCLAAFLAFGGLVGAQTPAPYDLVIVNARIVDGTGNPWYRGDIAIKGDTNAAIAPRMTGKATRVIDARGQVVAPGFIDPHTHASRGIFEVPTAENYIRQGVTTLTEGPDGGSTVPLKPYLDKIEALQITPNWAMFVGQGSIRSAVMGTDNKPASPADLER